MPLFGRRRPAPGPVVPPGPSAWLTRPPPGLAAGGRAAVPPPCRGRRPRHHPRHVRGPAPDGQRAHGRRDHVQRRDPDQHRRSDRDRRELEHLLDPALFQAGRLHPDVAVCAVELATIVPGVIVQPDRIPQIRHLGRTQTGNPAFDDHFRVSTIDTGFIRQILTPDVQQRIMMRDWVFWLGEYLFACVAKGKFRSLDEVSSRVTEVLDIVTAIPGTVMPSQVDQSADDLVARISRLDDVNDAIAFLQDLTPDERERLARSDTPLAAFADVRTPEEAIARFGSLPEAQRMQVLAMFTRVDGG